MDKKKGMNTAWAVVVILAFAGLIFISVKSKPNMDLNGNLGGSEDAAKGVETAKAGDVVAMNYTGKLSEGTVFDSNVDPKFGHVEPFVFPLGAGKVIAGWDKGIVGMKIGEKKTLVIPPEEAYGASGYPPVIPPNATLTFEVELIDIISSK
jgi:FKBP-type peptidyl-prolyl cis-trans isomerase